MGQVANLQADCQSASASEARVVDRPYTGTCYRAANWICVGQTQGRGRMDRTHTAQGTSKNILLYPLQSHWREHLCQFPSPLVCHASVGEIS